MFVLLLSSSPSFSLSLSYFAAGFSFSTGTFVASVPYDPYLPMVFMGEEISIGVRGFTHGYDFYTPLRSVCFHYYATGKNAGIRKKVNHFWEHEGDHKGSGKKSMNRLVGLIGMAPELTAGVDYDDRSSGKYGLGTVRDPRQFYGIFGIDVKKKTSAPAEGVCKFVRTGAMHRAFHDQFLRPREPGRDMSEGIDYGGVGEDFRIPGLDYGERVGPK